VTPTLNHTIVWCRDNRASAGYLADTLGLPPPTKWGPFMEVVLSNGVTLAYHNYYDREGEIASQHYAFLVTEEDFDAIFSRIRHNGQPY